MEFCKQLALNMVGAKQLKSMEEVKEGMVIAFGDEHGGMIVGEVTERKDFLHANGVTIRTPIRTGAYSFEGYSYEEYAWIVEIPGPPFFQTSKQ